jgi:hypothetical protein
VASQLPLSAVILEVEFMGFREDGLRGEFAKISSTSLIQELTPYGVGRDLAALASIPDAAGAVVLKKANAGIDGEFQQAVENNLSDALATVWPLWRDRVNLRSTLLGDLFTFRNWVFHISSQSERKIIKPRFIRNMAALEDFLKSFKASQTPVVLYFAPVRPDKPLPYDRSEYTQWKSAIQSLAVRYSAICLDLDKLVPAQHWGSNFGEDIDFMHFQEAGHKLVAGALQPVVAKVMR